MILLLACARPPLSDWIEVHDRVAYVLEDVDADGGIQSVAVTEVWTALGPGAWRNTLTLHHDPPAVSVVDYRLDASGWAWTREDFGDGTTLDYLPPKILLHPRFVDGWSWSAMHPGRRGPVRRTCVERAGSPFCAGGWAVTCRSSMVDREVTLRDHYCPGEGWRGEEGAVWFFGQMLAGTRSRDVSFGETTLPDPPVALRPFASPDEVEHPRRAPR